MKRKLILAGNFINLLATSNTNNNAGDTDKQAAIKITPVISHPSKSL
jgi:hypothetical protein